MFGIDKDKIKAAFAAFQDRRQEIEASQVGDEQRLAAHVSSIIVFIDELQAAFS